MALKQIDQKMKRLSPTILFIFGGSGDLTKRKLIPALYNLFLDNFLPEKYVVVGVGRSAMSDDEYRAKLLEGVQEFSRRKEEISDKWPEFSKHVFYQSKDLEDDQAYKSI